METTYDVRFWKTDVYRGEKTTTYKVRWTVAGKPFKRPHKTAALANSFRSELVAAAKRGEAFYVGTGLPVSMDRQDVTTTWFTFASDYAAMKWPNLAANSRRCTARSLTDVTIAMVGTARGKPSAESIREACGWAFNGRRRNKEEPSADVRATVEWLTRHTRKVSDLTQPDTVRQVLLVLGTKHDGSKAAPSSLQRRRGPFVNALEYAVEKRLLRSNPVPALKVKTTRAVKELDVAVVVNPEQARALLDAVSRQGKSGKMLKAFFGVMYYCGLRPGEAVNLRRENVRLPKRKRNRMTGKLEPPKGEWGELSFTQSAPAAGAAWTDNGKRREVRQLKGREIGERRTPPCPPELVRLLWDHLDNHGTDTEGRLFRGVETGGEVPEGTYCRVWKKAREDALSDEECASPLAGRPYDLRHACVSTWLAAGVPSAQVARWAGHSIDVLHRIYAKVLADQEDSFRKRIDKVLSSEDKEE
ncbi:integrase [Lentzea sp. NBRC 105346]|uniref:tyrosine-type recombinase/integrase n=1 Tax=Lentzea sp. NBRC 105346 TaxID=3032205 RepID=UPI0024A416E4|nr:tyrosine-type recombinase/integrase [Lentzea sp. NBRC 105346]GLZ36332.1 integrase [Lentzea sp. NBRC 105346]